MTKYEKVSVCKLIEFYVLVCNAELLRSIDNKIEDNPEITIARLREMLEIAFYRMTGEYTEDLFFDKEIRSSIYMNLEKIDHETFEEGSEELRNLIRKWGWLYDLM